eukprot:2586915-Ditylum_brightwellii.AAC.1
MQHNAMREGKERKGGGKREREKKKKKKGGVERRREGEREEKREEEEEEGRKMKSTMQGVSFVKPFIDMYTQTYIPYIPTGTSLEAWPFTQG